MLYMMYMYNVCNCNMYAQICVNAWLCMPLLANHFEHFLSPSAPKPFRARRARRHLAGNWAWAQATNFSSFASEVAWEFQVEVLAKYGASKSRVLWLVLSLQVVKCFRKLGNCQVSIHQNTITNVSTILFEGFLSLLLVGHHGPQKKYPGAFDSGPLSIYIYTVCVYIYIYTLYIYIYMCICIYMYIFHVYPMIPITCWYPTYSWWVKAHIYW